MNSETYTDKITSHEDWKDGMNAFRAKVSRELTEIYQSLAKLETLTSDLVRYLNIKDEIAEIKAKRPVIDDI